MQTDSESTTNYKITTTKTTKCKQTDQTTNEIQIDEETNNITFTKKRQ